MNTPRSALPTAQAPFWAAVRLVDPALVTGDAAVLLMVTMIGFLTHGEALGARLLTTFLPLCAAWALVSPWLGVFRPVLYRRPAQVWRAALAMILCAPLAALLRALWLQAPIIPSFVIALGCSAAVLMTLWRLGWGWRTSGWRTRRSVDHG